jgi:hypothetical protein
VVATSAIRILDMVVVSFDEDGDRKSWKPNRSSAWLPFAPRINAGVLLSRHDIELVSLALRPPNAAIIVVAEDRWAESLSVATRAAGGEVRAGERIARERVELALARTTEGKEEQ